eukprot:gene9953-430_t
MLLATSRFRYEKTRKDIDNFYFKFCEHIQVAQQISGTSSDAVPMTSDKIINNMKEFMPANAYQMPANGIPGADDAIISIPHRIGGAEDNIASSLSARSTPAKSQSQQITPSKGGGSAFATPQSKAKDGMNLKASPFVPDPLSTPNQERGPPVIPGSATSENPLASPPPGLNGGPPMTVDEQTLAQMQMAFARMNMPNMPLLQGDLRGAMNSDFAPKNMSVESQNGGNNNGGCNTTSLADTLSQLPQMDPPQDPNVPTNVMVQFKRKRVLQFASATYIPSGQHVVVGGDRGEDMGLVIYPWYNPNRGTPQPLPNITANIGPGRVMRIANTQEIGQLLGLQAELEKQAIH